MKEVVDMTEHLLKHKQPVSHFLLMNVFDWRTGTDLHALMKDFDKKGYTYWVWFVPCEEKQAYQISFYQPQVEGSFMLAEVEKKPRVKR
jgi:hypothetical protein